MLKQTRDLSSWKTYQGHVFNGNRNVWTNIGQETGLKFDAMALIRIFPDELLCLVDSIINNRIGYYHPTVADIESYCNCRWQNWKHLQSQWQRGTYATNGRCKDKTNWLEERMQRLYWYSKGPLIVKSLWFTMLCQECCNQKQQNKSWTTPNKTTKHTSRSSDGALCACITPTRTTNK